MSHFTDILEVYFIEIYALRNSMKTEKQKNSKVYLIGSGIASLASAVYLEKDTSVASENIIILEKDQILGAALDGTTIETLK